MTRYSTRHRVAIVVSVALLALACWLGITASTGSVQVEMTPQSTVLEDVPVELELDLTEGPGAMQVLRVVCDVTVRTAGESPDEWRGECRER